MILFGLLVIYLVLIVVVDGPLLLKASYKQIITFSLFLLLGGGLIILKGLQFDIPNPLDWIMLLYKPLSDAIYSLL